MKLSYGRKQENWQTRQENWQIRQESWNNKQERCRSVSITKSEHNHPKMDFDLW